MIRSLTCLLLGFAVLATPLHAQQDSGQDETGPSAWIVDQLYLSLYPEPNSDSERIRLMVSGEEVQRLEEADNGFVRVRLENGTTGWLNGQYLVDEPPARVRIDDVEAERDQLAEDVSSQAETIASLREQVDTLEAERDQAARQAGSVGELQSRVNNLQAERDRLAEALSQRDERLASLEQTNQQLREQVSDQSEAALDDIVTLAQPVLEPENRQPLLAAGVQTGNEPDEATEARGPGLSMTHLATGSGVGILALALAGLAGYRLRERQLRQRLGGLSL
jgi:SH3 domain protein